MTTRAQRIMIVDRSEVARSIISHILQKEMQGAYTVTCGSAEEALEHLQREKFDLIITALLLPGLDGLDLCHEVRKSDKQHATPVIIVSSDADRRLLREGFSAGVTDYFNKSLGYKKLVEFIKDVSQRHAGLVGRVMYVEDSITVAEKTKALMQNHGLQITHVKSAEEAFDLLKKASAEREKEEIPFDVVITDFFLAGEMTGGDLLYAIRTQLHCSRQELPVLVVTVQDNAECQADIFHAGANDFVTKPVVEEVFIARIKSLLLIRHQYNVLKRYSKDIYAMATTDALTGVRNKQFLYEEGPDFVKKHPHLCLMMVDMDHLDRINRAHGDLTGDHILHVAGRFLSERFGDDPHKLVARFGGKTFVLMFGSCGVDQGREIAEELRLALIKLKPDGVDVTASIGLTASDPNDSETLGNLLVQADNALIQAKQNGFNQVWYCLGAERSEPHLKKIK